MTKNEEKVIKEKSKVSKEEWREYTKTVWMIANTSRDDHPAVFPEEIPRRLAKLFSFYGETVLDPFAGTGTTARAVIPLGRCAVCVDQNDAYIRMIKNEVKNIRNGHTADFEPLVAVRGDSRRLGFVEDNSIGLVVTSPPYWNKADYGASEENLGAIGSYSEFIEATRPVFEECFRVLQPGRKACIVTANVNQHTDHGLLTFPLATDFAVLLREIGFVMVNEIIWSKHGTGRKVGVVRGAASDLWKLPLSPKLPLQERSRIHTDFRQACADEKDRAEGEDLSRSGRPHRAAGQSRRSWPGDGSMKAAVERALN